MTKITASPQRCKSAVQPASVERDRSRSWKTLTSHVMLLLYMQHCNISCHAMPLPYHVLLLMFGRVVSYAYPTLAYHEVARRTLSVRRHRPRSRWGLCAARRRVAGSRRPRKASRGTPTPDKPPKTAGGPPAPDNRAEGCATGATMPGHADSRPSWAPPCRRRRFGYVIAQLWTFLHAHSGLGNLFFRRIDKCDGRYTAQPGQCGNKQGGSKSADTKLSFDTAYVDLAGSICCA